MSNRGMEDHVGAEGGVRLRLVRWGPGERAAPVVLVHGFSGSVEAWGEIPARLSQRLAAHTAGGAPAPTVVAVDLPGHGGSAAPADPERYRIEAVTRDLVAVLDHLGAERAIWVGYSMGGRVALATAALHPDRTRAVVLESASPGLETEGERRARRVRDEALAGDIHRDGLEAFVERWMALPLFETQRRLPGAVRSRERERRLLASPLGLANTLRGLGTGAQPSFWDRLAGLTAPVLLLTGAEDRKFTELAERMAGDIPAVHRVIVPGTGHAVHLEAPEVWLTEVAAFLMGMS